MENLSNSMNALLIPITEEQAQELKRLKKHFFTKSAEVMERDKIYNNTLIPGALAQLYPPTKNLDVLYIQLADLKKCLDSFRPIAPATIQNMQETWDIKYTYESNRIEGNSLTLDETMHVIEKGLTIGGKPLNDHLEAINHQEAIGYIRDLAERESDFNERILLNIHALVLKGIQDHDAGSYRRQPVFIVQADGTRHEFPDVYLVRKLIEDYFIFYEDNKADIHPVEMAAHLHQRLVNIHPFIDGNGRTSRLVMNLHLLKHGYPITIIDSEMKKRQEYYRILSQYRGVSDGDSEPFELFVAQKVKESLCEYLRFLSADQNEDSQEKGYYFFKKLEPHLA